MSYAVHVFRAEISRLPSWSRLIELMWKKSNGQAGIAGVRGGVGFAERDVVEARPLEHHQPGPARRSPGTSRRSRRRRRSRRPSERLQWIGSYAVISAVPCGVSWNSCRSACRPFPALHVRDFARRRCRAITSSPCPNPCTEMSPCHHVSTGLPVVFLYPQVGGRGVLRQRLEPDQPAARVEDHRPALAGPVIRCDELIAGRHRGRARGHGDRRRAQVRTRAKSWMSLGLPGWIVSGVVVSVSW